jgi:hypothetical protein
MSSTIGVSDAAGHGLVNISRTLISLGRVIVSGLSAETVLELFRLGLIDPMGVPTDAGLQVLRPIDPRLYAHVSTYLIRSKLYACTSVTHAPLEPHHLLKEADAARALLMAQLRDLGKVCEQARGLVEELEYLQF